ncbi:MAG: hypothetical protein NZ901_10015 [Geminocystis sp.]|nr:hypothetical protein [Geminocystis sp.]HIK36757.1 hypothetical protein [Geminocystis sp. M7585_C2015_104]MCS7148509.1 hypothetical protein [Geminocystis sp.]MCX8079465.1 hypothetical protein [Geminocystis sp.]MDW8114918.1 hypothetical protein [Geminocystis sp.]
MNEREYNREGSWLAGGVVLLLTGFFVVVGGKEGVLAERLTPETVAERVYQQMPELPRENHYIQKETGRTATENTLISRMVRYHQYVKSRPTGYRLDWKLTLADYLGKNEIMDEQRYPGSTTLTKNPLPGDKEAIRLLTRQQRGKLVELLVSIYNPTNKPEYKPQLQSDKGKQETREKTPGNPTPLLPKPGDAKLLLSP